jgi:hypothetical protein
LASECASYITGQVIHINGGEIVNSWKFKEKTELREKLSSLFCDKLNKMLI